MLIEWCKLEPSLQMPERFVIGHALGEMLQQGGMTSAESSPLRGEPPIEDWAAVDFQAL
jgi:hypothetical protein